MAYFCLYKLTILPYFDLFKEKSATLIIWEL